MSAPLHLTRGEILSSSEKIRLPHWPSAYNERHVTGEVVRSLGATGLEGSEDGCAARFRPVLTRTFHDVWPGTPHSGQVS